METELQKLKEFFLTDVDTEDYEENKQRIESWEKDLRENENFISFQQHPIAKQVVSQAKQSFKEASVLLARSRELSEQQRVGLWAKQDSALWVISLFEKDAKNALAGVKEEIKRALSVL